MNVIMFATSLMSHVSHGFFLPYSVLPFSYFRFYVLGDVANGISEQSKDTNENDALKQDPSSNSIKRTHKNSNTLPDDKVFHCFD